MVADGSDGGHVALLACFNTPVMHTAERYRYRMCTPLIRAYMICIVQSGSTTQTDGLFDVRLEVYRKFLPSPE